MLTPRQKTLLDLIEAHTTANGGVCPSYEELRRHMGLKATSGIHRLVKGLEARGFIRRLPHCARAIEVIRRPQTACPLQGPISAAGSPDPHPPRTA